ncbi:MAG: protein translocase subunit SecD, partial [Hyphomicrobium sp.]
MLHFERWKIIAIALVCLIGFFFAMPNLFSKQTVDGWPSWMPHRQLSLGLDLRGGAHLLLEMDTIELERDWLLNLRGDVRKQLRDAKIGFTGLGIVGDSVQVRIAKPEQADRAYTQLKKMIQPLGNPILGTSGEDIEVQQTGADTITVRPTAQGMQQRLTSASSSSVETIRRRVDSLGTTEPTIVRQGQERILVQVPGFEDTRKLKE